MDKLIYQTTYWEGCRKVEHVCVLTSSTTPINRLSSFFKDQEFKSKKLVNASCIPLEDRSIMLIYLDAQDANPINALTKIKSKWPKTLVIYIGNTISPELLIELFRSGLNDYLLQPISQKDIDESIDRMRARIKKMIFNPEHYHLKIREIQVCNLLTKGLNSKEIADYLKLSPATVKVYKSRLFNKLSVKTIPDLMRKILC